MAHQRNPPQSLRRSPARLQRVTRGRNAKNPRQFVSPSKHKKGPVLDKESLVRTQLQKELAHKSIATPLTDSDDSDRLVTRKTNVGTVQKPIYASGGVAPGDTPGAHPSRKRKSMDDGLNEATSAERRRQTSHAPGLKRPAKSSLSSPFAPTLPNAPLPSSPSNLTPSSPAVAVPLASSAVRPNLNASVIAAAETSIIGTLKPRKRQPSILQIIETNDSSRLTVDDENEFLPDDESTPLPISRTTAAISTPGSSLRRPNKDISSSSGLKRPTPSSKRRAPSGILGASDSTVNSIFTASPTLPELPVNEAAKQKTLKSAGEDSVMAPPVSSSPEAPPTASKMKANASSKSKKPTNKSMSTEALQSMMPRQSQRPQRQKRQARSEFDIPEDSAGSQAQLDGTSDNSEGSPFKPQRKAGRRKQTQTQTAGRNKRGASVLSNITTNSKVSKNGRGASNKAQKEKGSGGARHFDTISSAKGRGAEKENTPLPDGLDDELQKVRDKFAEVDEWDMEFEDVEVLDRSSQEGFR